MSGQNAPVSADQAGAVLTIDLAAITENWHLLKRKLKQGCDCGAVVKADAYGLGAANVAAALAGAGCKTFYVAHLGEGIELRKALGRGARIIVMHGANPGLEGEVFKHGLIPVLSTPEQILAWRTFATDADVLQETLIQVDTGMNRLGLSEAEFTAHLNDPDCFQGLTPLALMSHLACAGTPDHPLNAAQLERFASALSAFRTKFPDAKGTLSNSAGIFLGDAWHFDYARPGAALYGLNPQPDGKNPMLPVARLQAKILQIRRVDSTQTVGYGATFQAADGMKLATVSVGYADGFLRALSNAGAAQLDGIPIRVAGIVSMDLLTFDISNVPDSSIRPGAMIDILAQQPTADDLANDAGTIGYEILTSLGHRYARRYLPASVPGLRS
ncbi:MAG: alanine racemase [Alphaproteobacteria bacterium]|nr:alanine racemase [Alphaproteobacteria bacterium]